MKILIANNTTIPVKAYGGTERVIWWLGKELVRLGHEVVYLVKKGSSCPFAKVLILNEKKPIVEQIPKDIDIAHFHFEMWEELPCPVLFTIHGNTKDPEKNYHPNTVFVSKNHAKRHGGNHHVYNGIDFDDYGRPDLANKRKYVHFLANAAWRVKNLNGAIEIAAAAHERLHVIGGSRLNFRMGIRFTMSPNVRFHGMLGGDGKNVVLNASKALLFPVLWHEPFGLSIIESLYFGCPVFGTPYGSLPELLNPSQSTMDNTIRSDFGVLSENKSELIDGLSALDSYDRQRCHDYVMDCFSSKKMALDYLHYYEQLLDKKPLHTDTFSPILPHKKEELLLN